MKTPTLFCLFFIFPLVVFSCNIYDEGSGEETSPISAVETINLQTLISRIKAHQSDSSLSFAFITDLHNSAQTKTYAKDNCNIQKIERIVTAVNEINKRVGLCCVVLGGDYLWNTSNTSKVAAEDALEDFSQTVATISELPILCLKGNHDDNTIAGLSNSLMQEEFYDFCVKRFECDEVFTDNYNQKGCYGYFDFAPQKVRFIYVNSVDLPWIERNEGLLYKGQWHKGVRQQQLDFIASALKFDEEGWGVIFISHHAVTSIEGYNTSDDTYITPDNGGKMLYGIISAYKKQGVYLNDVVRDFESRVSVDYGECPKGEVICLLNGHIHCDRNATHDGMLFCSTTSATLGNGANTNSNGSIFNPESQLDKETAFDIITIDRHSGIVYFDRCGFGESREFKYKYK